ncbi:MAG: hypothetical protein KJ600_05115 [Nanoarchaeota archaeon]|nr:hypothetical protein [Nanoarchaeota archaeon]MBU1103911.1 hypothetical protein [Nanoarchaeota archaeon]
MNGKLIFGWIFVVAGFTALLYGDMGDVAPMINVAIGVYLIVNSEKAKKK